MTKENLKEWKTFKILFLGILLILTIHLEAQVTIGSGLPPQNDALLDLKEDSDGSSTKGLLMPRVPLISTVSPSPLNTHVKGMLVYNTSTSVDVTPGLYFNDGVKWIKSLSNSEIVPQGDIVWVNDPTNNMVKINYKSDGQEEREVGTEFVAKDNGNVGIGTTNPDASAILDLNSKNKGFLIPRIALSTINDATAVPNPAKGLVVYNTNVDALSGEGIYYNSGTSDAPMWSAVSKVDETSGSSIGKIKYLGAVNANNILTIDNVSFRFMEPSGTASYRYEIQIRVDKLPKGKDAVTYRSNRIDFYKSDASASSNIQERNLTYTASEVAAGEWKTISAHSGYNGTHSNIMHISCDESPIFIRLTTQEKFGVFWSMIAELY